MKTDIIQINHANYFRPILEFDPMGLQEDRYYGEALKHLKQDIDNFEERFKWIENQCKEYKENLDDFETKGITNLISRYLEENGFNTYGEAGKSPQNNNIIIYPLEQELRDYWRIDEDFRPVWWNDLLKINNITIALVEKEQDKRKLEYCIEHLKKYDKINQGFHNIKEYYNNIIREADSLGKEIEDKIIMKIEKRTYITTCDECSG